MADLTVQSLLNTAVYDSYTGITLSTKTVAQLKADIQTATGVDVAWFDLVLNEQVLTGTDTLTAAGVSDGDALRTHNKIARLATRELRQKAKLALAELDRAASGYDRDTYDIAQLPTYYVGDTVTDNPNAGGLIEGRPWAELDTGLYLQGYTGYFADNVNWFATATTTGSPSTPSTLTIASIPTTTSYQYLGYFRAPVTGTYTFYSNSDDASYVWVGGTASSGFTTGNALINNGGVHPPTEVSGTIALVEGHLYAFRIQVGNNAAGGVLGVSFAVTGISKTSNFTNYVFHNPNTTGL
jgi:hypothetical protein